MFGRRRASSVRRAMDETPRAGYLPEGARSQAGIDAPVAIGHEATCSQPTTVRTMLELLDVAPGHRVLDVGCGSGWTTAILARLVGPGGSVVGVDIVPELVEDAAARLRRDGLAHATVGVAAAGELGAPEAAPFDRILVSAMARELPARLVEQLTDDGRMVLPVGGRMVTVTRVDGEPHVEPAPGYYRFVPLRQP